MRYGACDYVEAGFFDITTTNRVVKYPAYFDSERSESSRLALHESSPHPLAAICHKTLNYQ